MGLLRYISPTAQIWELKEWSWAVVPGPSTWHKEALTAPSTQPHKKRVEERRGHAEKRCQFTSKDVWPLCWEMYTSPRSQFQGHKKPNIPPWVGQMLKAESMFRWEKEEKAAIFSWTPSYPFLSLVWTWEAWGTGRAGGERDRYLDLPLFIRL